MAKQNNELIFTGNESQFADSINARIADEKTAHKLTMICATNAVTDFAGVKLAYYIASVSDADAKRENFKSATEMIMDVCNLKKSMVSNYRSVGAMVTDSDGNFVVPDAFRGFSVTQLVEAKAKLVTKEAIETAVNEGEIDCTMSAKTIRENLTTQEEAEKNALTKDRQKRASTAKAAVKFGRENGIPICIYRENGETDVIGYAIANEPYSAFVNDIKSGFAFLAGKENQYSIRIQ